MPVKPKNRNEQKSKLDSFKKPMSIAEAIRVMRKVNY